MSAPFRRLLTPIVLLLAAASTAVVPVGHARSASLPGSVVISGGGWGHGVGLSQWGAYGMAKLAGAGHAEILSHYYTGTGLDELGRDLPGGPRLWVNIERDIVGVTIRSAALAASPEPAEVRRRGPDTKIEPGTALTITRDGRTKSGKPRCVVTTTTGFRDRGRCRLDLAWDGDADDPETRMILEAVDRAIDGRPGSPCTMIDWNSVPVKGRPCAYSRGEIHIRPHGNGFHLVVEIDVEDYVLGISEMPYYWGLQGSGGYEALAAQAIAARTYAVRRALDRGSPSGRKSCWCHLHDTPVDQRYVGWGHSGIGQSTWIRAVRETAGVVVTHPRIGRNGHKIPIIAFYGSSSYGRTETGDVGLATPAVYLKSVDDGWATDPRLANPQATWSRALAADDIERTLGWSSGRDLADVTVETCSDSGAAAALRFVDDRGDADVRPTWMLRTLFGLRSPQITDIDGHPACRSGSGDASRLIRAGKRIDDGPSGDSSGDGDAQAGCGETVELFLTLRNRGDGSSSGVVASLAVSDPYVRLLYNSRSGYPDLPPAGSAENLDDWDLAIAEKVPAGHVVGLVISLRDGNGNPRTLHPSLRIRCGSSADPRVRIGRLTVDDGLLGDSRGDLDRRAECGERIELYARVGNRTGTALEGVAVKLTSTGRRLERLYNESSRYPDIAAAGSAENVDDWDLDVAGSAAGRVRLGFEISWRGGSARRHSTLRVRCVP